MAVDASADALRACTSASTPPRAPVAGRFEGLRGGRPRGRRARGDVRARARDGRRLAVPRGRGADRPPRRAARVRRARRGHGDPVPASVGESAGRVLVLAGRARRAAAARPAARALRRARAADPRPARGQPATGSVEALEADDARRARRRSVLDFAAHPELAAAFPFPHEVRLEATLTAGASDDRDERSRHRRRSGADQLRLPSLPAAARRRPRRMGRHAAASPAPPARRSRRPHRRDRGAARGRVRARRPPLRRRLRPAARRRRVLRVGREPHDHRHVRARLSRGAGVRAPGLAVHLLRADDGADERAPHRRRAPSRSCPAGSSRRRSRSRCADVFTQKG